MLEFAAFVLERLCEARHAGPAVVSVVLPAVQFGCELAEHGVSLGHAPSTSNQDAGDDAERDANNTQDAERHPGLLAQNPGRFFYRFIRDSALRHFTIGVIQRLCHRSVLSRVTAPTASLLTANAGLNLGLESGLVTILGLVIAVGLRRLKR
jgi:hypothetical protein